MKTRVSFKYFVTDCLLKRLFDSNSPQTPSNLISLAILVTLTPFTLLHPKAIKSQKKAKICIT